MITLLVPSFKTVWPVGAKHHEYEFTGYVQVEVNDQPNDADYQKVTSILPGIPCGYCPALYEIGKTRQPIPITSFYDSRQRGVNKLKCYFISILTH